jgi:hypothetical protein
MLALMLSVPIKVEAQAAYNVLSVKHLAKIRGGLLYAVTSAVPWAILPKTHVRARRDGLWALWGASSVEGGDSGSGGCDADSVVKMRRPPPVRRAWVTLRQSVNQRGAEPENEEEMVNGQASTKDHEVRRT